MLRDRINACGQASEDAPPLPAESIFQPAQRRLAALPVHSQGHPNQSRLKPQTGTTASLRRQASDLNMFRSDACLALEKRGFVVGQDHFAIVERLDPLGHFEHVPSNVMPGQRLRREQLAHQDSAFQIVRFNLVPVVARE